MAGKSPSKVSKVPAKQSGGARAGAGRPRDRLPTKLLDAIGDVPTDPAKFDDWRMKALAALFKAQASGDVGSDLAASLRATLGEMRRNAVAGPTASNDDETSDEEDEGPELETTTAPDALRVNP